MPVGRMILDKLNNLSVVLDFGISHLHFRLNESSILVHLDASLSSICSIATRWYELKIVDAGESRTRIKSAQR